MEEKLKLIEDKISKVLQDQNVIVSSINYLKEGKYNFLRIELDKVNGLDLDSIVAATNLINPLIDKLGLIDDSYILDVVSKESGGN